MILRTALAASILASGRTLEAQTTQASTTERFVDSIGVNVHWGYPHYDSNYSTLKAKLDQLGVRHLRDGAVPAAYLRSMDLYNTYGIKTTFITGKRFPGSWPKPLDLSQIPAELNEIKTNALACVAGIEGPNEYDISSPQDGSEPDWRNKLHDYQETLWDTARADASFQSKPIIGPSLTSPGAYAALGNMDPWMDYSCIHHYQSSRHPGTGGWGANGYGSITWAFAYLANVQSPSFKPVQSTECGYHQSIYEAGVNEAVDAKYTLRMLSEFFRRGYHRSFKYEFMNAGTSGTEQLYGLLRNDLSEKPSFTALKNLIALVKEPGASFSPGSFNYTLSGATNDVHQVLLQKSNGQFFLVIWKEVASWDVNANTSIAVAPNNVTLTFNQPVAEAAVYKPSVSTAAQSTYNNPTSVNLSVPDELLIVKITPASTGTSLISSQTLGTLRNNFTGSVGFKFTVGSSPITVTHLGRWVVSGDTGTHTVKLVKASDGTDVPLGSVTVSTFGGPAGTYAYVPIGSAVTLSANTAYYLVSSETAGGDRWYDTNTIVTASSAATVNASIYYDTSYHVAQTGSRSYGPVNFKYVAGIANGIYRLAPACNPNAAVSVTGNGGADGTSVVEWTFLGASGQKWNITANGDATYRISPTCNLNAALSVSGNQPGDGTSVVEWTWWGGSGQKWWITSNGDGTYRLTPTCNPNAAYSVWGNQPGDGTSIVEWTWWGGSGQRFYLVAP
jgi:hypothetical protein